MIAPVSHCFNILRLYWVERPCVATACLIFLLDLAGIASTANAQTLEQRLLGEPISVLATDARREGDPIRGAAVFYARALACSTCHSVGDREGAIGPDLANLGPKMSDTALIESVLEPSKTIAPQFATVTVVMTDGRVLSGLPVQDNEDRLVLRDLAQPDRLVTIRKLEIEDRKATKQSIMPGGQVNQLANRQQFLDLVRYLIEVRDGGPVRARALQPVSSSLSQETPDRPLAWRPSVQRGEVAVEQDVKYPHAVALGFVGGTVLFDADQLGTAAWWNEGFVKHSPQNYFGLYWQRAGGAAGKGGLSPHPMTFRFSENEAWQSFEAAAKSDPNVGTRFDGYQIGKSAVRLHYRCLVGNRRIAVTEDVRAESRLEWQGFVREFRFLGLPMGGQVSLTFPKLTEPTFYASNGGEISPTDDFQRAPLLAFRTGDQTSALRVQATDGATWLTKQESGGTECRLISGPAASGQGVALRIDQWKYCGRNAAPTTAELANLLAKPPVLDDLFDAPSRPSPPPPEWSAAAATAVVASRPGLNPRENIDEFPASTGRFLRFVTTNTNDGSEPGLDELEIYGPESPSNLALRGKATASSVIAGYAIHQIPHLNDGKLGNLQSWISAERGAGWAQIEFVEPVKMNKIVWARDRTGVCRDRLPTAYRIEVSTDGKTWSKVGDESERSVLDTAIGAIRRDAAPGYVMEAIPTPFPTCRPSDIAFGEEGTMYAIAMTEGQIWRTKTPAAGHPERVQWQCYATGLYHPLGIAIVDGRLYVAQKQEITELIDHDGDGRVEHFRTVASGWGLSTGWHEYCFGLAVDPQKNLWFALNTGYFWTNPGYVNPGRWRGSILRISHGTENLEEMAKGCRVPNGITQGPEGNIFFTDNQGDWIQACKLAQVVPKRFYGHPETSQDALPKGSYPDGRSAIWLPYDRCRSVSGPVHNTTQEQFGPFSDQMFVGDVGYGANAGIMRIALEKVKGEYQGACFPFVVGQPLGCERMKFGPDNQLYMASLSSGLTRMAFDGKIPPAIHSIHLRAKGIGFEVKLTKGLAEGEQITPKQVRVKRYHYLYTGQYGSPQADETEVVVERVEISADRTGITLTFPVESYPIGMVYAFDFENLTFAEGAKLHNGEAWYTVHQIPD